MSSGKEGLLKIRDSAGFDWEEVSYPSPPPPPSNENAHLIPPEPTSVSAPLCAGWNSWVSASRGSSVTRAMNSPQFLASRAR